MGNSSFTNIIKRHKKLIAFLLVSILTIFLLSKYSFMNIEVPGQSGTFTYTIVNQADQTKSEVKSSSNKLKRLVPRGNYEILVTKDGASSFAVTKTGGFLGNTDLRLSLSPEKSRQFVGDNPRPCMFLEAELYSFECGEVLSSLVRHVPATASQPGYTVNVPLPLNGVDEGVILLGQEVYFLAQVLSEESNSGTHSLYRFSGSQITGQPAVLADLDNDSAYSAIRYKEGFLAYKSDFSDIKYYPGPSAKPTDISLAKPTLENLNPGILSVGGGGILAVYTDANADDFHDDETTSYDVRNEIILGEDKLSKSIQLTGLPISDAVLCSPTILCVLAGKDLSVYDVSGKKHRFLYKITGVNKIMLSGDNLLAVRDSEILSLNIEGQSGFIDYNFGPYQSCGSHAQNGNYILCMIAPNSQKSALLIDRATENTDSIDKKIARVGEQPEIETVSAYRNIIYITPSLGPLIYREDIRGYGYNPVVQKQVSGKLDQTIDKIGIDRNKYQLINPLGAGND